jgi:type IV fimbrial biogenesis protein FimT
MVVLAVSAILLTLAVPGFAGLMRTSNLTSATNVLVSSLHLTRSEAIKRNGRVVMCPSATGTTCTESGWQMGWLVFHDANNDVALNAGEAVILRQPGMPHGYRLTGNSAVSRYVSYSSTGEAKMVSGAFQAGTLTGCDASDPSSAREVIISSTGRPRTVRAALASCP